MDSSCLANDGLFEFQEQTPQFEQEWDYIEDCLMNPSSDFSRFDHTKMFDRATTVLNAFCSDEDTDKRNIMKSRVVTLFFRQLSSLLSLSKNQNNKLVNFLKNMMLFISPESEEITKKIFESYDSCRRQSLKESQRKHLLCKRYMDQCLFFFNRS